MPYFLSSMWMKLWVLSTATSFMSLLATQTQTSRVICFGPLLLTLAYQAVLHMWMSAGTCEAMLGAVVNSFSIGRTTPRHDNQVLRTFRAETAASSVVFSLFSAAAVALSISLLSHKQLWQACTCVALVFMHIVITQAYLYSHWGKEALFPQDLQFKSRRNSLKPSKSFWLKWTFLAISLVAAGVAVVVSTQLFRGKEAPLHSATFLDFLQI